MKLLKYRKLAGKIELITGLHIGGSQEATQIGGMDNPVIRLPHNNLPYIPGSSLKGKMRSLLELQLDKVEDNGKCHTYSESCEENKCPICYIFGAGASEKASIGPARLVVRDCLVDMENETVKLLLNQSMGLPLSEEKTEVGINRIKSAVEGSLRKTERVPAGVVFNLDMTFRVFDDDADLFEYVKKGLDLVQKDALGGSGSRGYGKIEFKDLTLDGEKITLPEV